MKWLRNSMVSLTFLACCFSYGDTATKDELKTVFLRLYTGNDIEEHIDVHLEEAETIIQDLNISKPTVFYVHGYTESLNSTSVHVVINAYLNRSDHNVLAVDWSVIAGKSYDQVAVNAGPVGTAVALAINDIVHAGLPSENIHVVGHSMGAQVSAYVGRKVDFSLQRITGLDPAGPLFNFFGRHLTYADARFVDIIHTDMGFYGIAMRTGTVDFFPNGGHRIQPGCPTTFLPFSHEEKDLTALSPALRHPMVSRARVLVSPQSSEQIPLRKLSDVTKSLDALFTLQSSSSIRNNTSSLCHL